MATEKRQKRVAEFIRKEAALLISELNDPRVGFITVTSVKVTQDLSSAKIFYSVLGSEADQRLTEHALAHAKGYLRRKIGSALQIKSVPEIQFVLLSDSEESKENKEILNLIEKARQSDPDFTATKTEPTED